MTLKMFVRGLVVLFFATVSVAHAQERARVYDTHGRGWIGFDHLIADLAEADVLFVGERHNHAPTQAMELALLEALSAKRDGGSIVVSLEMFARDVQAELDAYLAGTIDEAAFLAGSRPWPGYQQGYRPLVEWARARALPVVAANVPRPFASKVAGEGLAFLASLPPDERRWAAADWHCPKDDEYQRFAKGMFGAAADDLGNAAKQLEIERGYQAVCLQDETMSESIAGALAAAGPGALVVHYNGSFHSDFGRGAAARARRRLPGSRVVVLTILAVPALDAASPTEEDIERADYLVYVPMRAGA